MYGHGLFQCITPECRKKFYNPEQYFHHFNHEPHAAKYPFKCESCPIGRPPFETQAAYADHLMVNVDKYSGRRISIIHL